MKNRLVYPPRSGLVHRVRWTEEYGAGRRTLCGRSIKGWRLGAPGDSPMAPPAAREAGRCISCEAVSA